VAWKPRGGNPWGSIPPSGGDGGDFISRFQDRMGGLVPGFGRGRRLWAAIGVVFLAAWLVSGFFQVEPAEQGVVLRFGQWVRSEPQGLHWHLPFPVERAVVIDVTNVNRVDIGYTPGETQRAGSSQIDILEESLMLTGDENIVNVSFTVFWVIDDPENFLFNIQSPQVVTVKEVAESVMRETIGKANFQEAITKERGLVEAEVQQRLQATLNAYQAGILLTGVQLAKVEAPPQVITAFRDVQAAVQDSTRFQNEAKAYANEIVPKAEGEAAKILQQAEAYKEQIIAKATGEASRFTAVFEEYAKARDVTKRRIYLETLEEVLTGRTKIVVDDKAGTGVVPYLALPELDSKKKPDGGGP